ncbi:hypothetical protein DAPPUDRAFT_105446 [Daphnia pulex]|uniref:Uncharacterized protein n=1 Tax=Daphnia pulex TaxID=6669 RepID=E9GQU8_DAPPU|nr:hypothetical protein DAPPUDRAFT_105446 [Daphnia pulex]|eukprot:EFX78175.1 hypothetical protein DAPPUDRAFT_105446 [Daphnia pulex]
MIKMFLELSSHCVSNRRVVKKQLGSIIFPVKLREIREELQPPAKIGKKNQRIRRAQLRREGLLPPWVGPQQPRAYHNTPAGRREELLRRSLIQAQVVPKFVPLNQEALQRQHLREEPERGYSFLEDPRIFRRLTPLENFLPVVQHHVSLEELQESLRPRYYGDIRYRPADPPAPAPVPHPSEEQQTEQSNDSKEEEPTRPAAPKTQQTETTNDSEEEWEPAGAAAPKIHPNNSSQEEELQLCWSDSWPSSSESEDEEKKSRQSHSRQHQPILGRERASVKGRESHKYQRS